MTLLGVWLAFGSGAESDPFRLRSLFLSAGVLTALAVMPDPAESYARRRDVLGHLPVGRATTQAARLVFLLVVIALVLVPYAAPTLAHVAWRGEMGAGALAALLPALFVMAMGGAGLWLSLAYAVAGRFGIDAVRRISSVALSIVMLSVVLLGSISMLGGGPRSLSIAVPWLAAAPTSWFANWLLPDAEARAGLEAAGAAALTVLSLALLLRLRPEAIYEQQASRRGERDDLAVRLASFAQRRLPARGPMFALASLVLRVTSREPMARMRARSIGLSLLAVWVMSLFFEGFGLSLPLVAAFAFMHVSGGVLGLAMSADAEASWTIAAAPLAEETKMTALRVAVLLRSSLLPAALVALLAGREGGALDALLFGATFLVVAIWLASAVLALRPREPLATGASVAGGNVLVWLGLPLGMGALVAFAPVWWFSGYAAPIALGTTALYAASIAAFAQGFANWAAMRLRTAAAAR